MALYRAIIRKSSGTLAADETAWTNTYTISATGAANALLVAENIANAEAICHSTEVQFREAAVTPVIKHSENGRQITLNFLGERVPGVGALPLWNVVLCRFLDLDASRPEKKFLRLPVYEADHDGGLLAAGIVADVNAYATAVLSISAGGYVCGPKGETWTGHETVPQVVMRQVNWHRHSRPGFKRGYVPKV